MDYIGWILTIILGGASIYLYFRREYPGKIICYYDKKIPLLYTLAESFEDVKIIFKDKPINSQLVILKLFLVNIGDKDISKELVKLPITLNFPDFVKLQNIKLTASTENMKCCHKILNDSAVEIEFDLLRRREFIQVEILLEDNSFNQNTHLRRLSSISQNDLIFTHRIVETKKIIVESLQNFKKPPKYYKTGGLIKSITLIVSLFLVWFLLPNSLDMNQAKGVKYLYPLHNKDSVVFYTRIEPLNLNQIKLINTDINYEEVVSIDSILNNVTKLKIVSIKKYNQDTTLAGKIVLSIIILILLAISLNYDYRMKLRYEIFSFSIDKNKIE